MALGPGTSSGLPRSLRPALKPPHRTSWRRAALEATARAHLGLRDLSCGRGYPGVHAGKGPGATRRRAEAHGNDGSGSGGLGDRARQQEGGIRRH